MLKKGWTEKKPMKRCRTMGPPGHSMAGLILAAVVALTLAGCKGSPPEEPPPSEPAISVKEYLKSLFKDDPESRTEFERIQGEFRTGKHSQALEDLQTLLEGTPQAPWAESVEFYRAQALTALRKYGRAVRQLDALLQQYPNSPAVPRFLISKAQIYLALGKLRRTKDEADPVGEKYLRNAQGIFQQVSKEYPNNPDVGAEALYYSGETAASLKEIDLAREAFRKILEHYGDSDHGSKALYSLAGMYMGEADLPSAEEALKQLTEKYPKTRLARKADKKLKGLQLVGSQAPQLQIKEWIGDAPSEEDIYRGKVTLLSFWAIWCPHCKRNIPKLDLLAATYGKRGVSVVGVTREKEGQGADKVKEFIESHPMSFPTGVDDEGKTSKELAVMSIPCVIAVDAQGRIRWHGHPDHLSNKVIEGLLEPSS